MRDSQHGTGFAALFKTRRRLSELIGWQAELLAVGGMTRNAGLSRANLPFSAWDVSCLPMATARANRGSFLLIPLERWPPSEVSGAFCVHATALPRNGRLRWVSVHAWCCLSRLPVRNDARFWTSRFLAVELMLVWEDEGRCGTWDIAGILSSWAARCSVAQGTRWPAVAMATGARQCLKTLLRMNKMTFATSTYHT